MRHQRHIPPEARGVKSIRELALDLTHAQYIGVITFLRERRIAFYECPAAEPPYKSLKEVEADCMEAMAAGVGGAD